MSAIATHPETLVLNANGLAISRTPWQRAMMLLLDGKADMVESYGVPVHPQIDFEWPAVIRLREFVSLVRRPKLTRAHVIGRDGFTCQFCGAKPVTGSGRPMLSELSIDHVIPRAQAVNGRVRLVNGKQVPVTSWENLATACKPCNFQKRDRTPEQAGMRLRRAPRVPNAMDTLRITLSKASIPREWVNYLPQDSEWRGYWDAELDPT